ncbi:MAG: hypothetical protein SOR95_08150 [Sutterella sp.]|nr:hypothetical protein [Sutterella sp.]
MNHRILEDEINEENYHNGQYSRPEPKEQTPLWAKIVLAPFWLIRAILGVAFGATGLLLLWMSACFFTDRQLNVLMDKYVVDYLSELILKSPTLWSKTRGLIATCGSLIGLAFCISGATIAPPYVRHFVKTKVERWFGSDWE